METHFRHKRTTLSNSFGVVVSTVAQHSFKVLGGGSNPSGPTIKFGTRNAECGMRND